MGDALDHFKLSRTCMIICKCEKCGRGYDTHQEIPTSEIREWVDPKTGKNKKVGGVCVCGGVQIMLPLPKLVYEKVKKLGNEREALEFVEKAKEEAKEVEARAEAFHGLLKDLMEKAIQCEQKGDWEGMLKTRNEFHNLCRELQKEDFAVPFMSKGVN